MLSSQMLVSQLGNCLLIREKVAHSKEALANAPEELTAFVMPQLALGGFVPV
jgi:hypothetical protein